MAGQRHCAAASYANAAVHHLAGLSGKFPILTRIYNPQLLNSHLPSRFPRRLPALICRQVRVRST